MNIKIRNTYLSRAVSRTVQYVLYSLWPFHANTPLDSSVFTKAGRTSYCINIISQTRVCNCTCIQAIRWNILKFSSKLFLWFPPLNSSYKFLLWIPLWILPLKSSFECLLWISTLNSNSYFLLLIHLLNSFSGISFSPVKSYSDFLLWIRLPNSSFENPFWMPPLEYYSILWSPLWFPLLNSSSEFLLWNHILNASFQILCHQTKSSLTSSSEFLLWIYIEKTSYEFIFWILPLSPSFCLLWCTFKHLVLSCSKQNFQTRWLLKVKK